MDQSTTPDAALAASCPPDELLVEMLLSPAQSEGFAAVIEHLAVCSDCRCVTAEAARVLSSGAGDLVAATFPRGALIGGRYRLEGLIGRGGMGEVYRALAAETGEPVALKTLACTRADDASSLRRFEREIRHATSVRHSGVCRVLDFGFHQLEMGPGRAETLPFLVMELLTGRTLEAELDACGALALPNALEALAQLLEALQAIHVAGIIHRDLKCANIFVRQAAEGRTFVITDFGLARSDGPFAGRSSTGTALLGSLDYMAPEQLRREPASTASDLYALGVVGFRMLTGRLPFQGNDPMERAAARLTREPERPSDHVEIPAAVDDLISRLLRPDPRKRLGSASEALRALAATCSRRAGI